MVVSLSINSCLTDIESNNISQKGPNTSINLKVLKMISKVGSFSSCLD